MAFKADSLTLIPGARGKGGVVHYFDGEDTVANMKLATYWNQTISRDTVDGQKNADARAALEDFVQAQFPNGSAAGVPVHFVGSDGTEMGIMYIAGSGRIQLRTGAAWIID